FKAEVDRHARSLRDSRPLPGGEPVRLPGEIELGLLAQHRAHGVAVEGAVLALLREHAARTRA
ncbi:MAG: hypothetical protein Q8L92_06960, partial [Rubrivivax sp.]|nr:hypothetical protein [Rubrivivax sp.]